MRTFLREILGILVLVAVILFLLQTIIQWPLPVVVYSCMEPNFHEGDRLLVNRAVYYFREPERGDVITLHPPFNNKTIYIKRIIALPGDTVEVKMGAVYVNGSKLYEPYIKEPPTYTFHQKKIPENEYFVLGDNRNAANDSHTGWTLPRQNIIGNVWIIVWPPNEWEIIPKYSLIE